MMDDLISRRAVIEEIKNADVCVTWHGYVSPEDSADIAIRATKGSVIESIKQLPSAQPVDKDSNVPCNDTISRQAVEQLDKFTKVYCRDKTVKDDLVFRCEECEFFEAMDGKCLVKVMARKLCPDFREFGAMGDL